MKRLYINSSLLFLALCLTVLSVEMQAQTSPAYFFEFENNVITNTGDSTTPITITSYGNLSYVNSVEGDGLHFDTGGGFKVSVNSGALLKRTTSVLYFKPDQSIEPSSPAQSLFVTQPPLDRTTYLGGGNFITHTVQFPSRQNRSAWQQTIDTTWHMLAIRYDFTNGYEYFLDGSWLEEVTNGPSFGADWDSIVVVGNDTVATSGADLFGTMDNLQFYTTALTDQAVDSIYQDFFAKYRKKDGIKPSISDSALVLYSPFDQLSVDNKVGVWDGTSSRDSILMATDRFGNANSALKFNADSSDFVEYPDAIEIQMGASDFALSFWIKGDGNMDGYIIGKRRPFGDFEQYGAFVNGSNMQFFIRNSNKTNRVISVPKTRFTIDSAWHHVVLLNDYSDSIYAYVDTVLYSSGGTTNLSAGPDSLINAEGTPFYIGKTSAGGSVANFFSGMIDDLIIYKRLLTEQEIISLFDAPDPCNAQIVQQPLTANVVEGKSASLTIKAFGFGLDYQWYKNGVELSNQKGESLTFNNLALSDSGDYHVRVKSDCDTVFSDTVSLNVDPATTIDGQLVQRNIKVYPNPVENHLRLQFESYEKERLIHLKNIQGQLVRSLRAPRKSLHIDMGNLSNGVYLLSIEGKENYSLKVVKK